MLAARDHETLVVSRKSFDKEGEPLSGSPPDSSNTLTLDEGVKVYAIPYEVNFEKALYYVIGQWKPDCVLIGEDPTYLSLAVAIDTAVKRIVVLALSQATLPFGPEAFYPDPNLANLFKPPVEIVTMSQYVSEYIHRWGQLATVRLPQFLQKHRHAPALGHFDNPYIMFINASKIKGLPIVVQLAQEFPASRFAAVRGWATTSHDISELSRHDNMTLLQPKEDVDEIYSLARLLLVPSLWGEAFGMVALEAMVRGIPVLASDIGGLPEAKLNVDYLLPVNPVSGYKKTLDERLLPEPIIPEQNMEPWKEALRRLLHDRERYDQLSLESRSVALTYLESLDENQWVDYLEEK
ncbi:MAG: glycosyltransferase family 4 protein [Nitrospirales bacterium]